MSYLRTQRNTGAFQTAAYSAAMLSFWINFLDAPNDIDQAVAIRMRRQDIIRRGGKRFVVLIEEQALRTWFGDADIQADQLRHLLAVTSLSNVSFGIIPLMTERVAVGSAGFWIFDDNLVALETPTASIEVNRPDEIGLYAHMFEALKVPAVYGSTARKLITQVIDELP
ncbi:MAG TPA: DUF5753 domain-containing protein [Pseudonocardia sp.]|uniref:DUF5753 domain-containing protein n=1 Tax=Pseudonocardia sp. TaxID=60912 RepID=UPI002F415B75